MGDSFTNIMRRVTREGVRRLDQLEVLILMTRRPADPWTAEELARESLLSAELASAALEQLHRLDFVERLPGDGPAYKLGQRVELDELLEIRRVYQRDRLRVVNEFFDSNLEILRGVAGACKKPRGS